MLSLFDFSTTLAKFNKEKNYVEAIKYFNNNKSTFSSKEISSNDYLVSAVITALRHTNNIEKAFKFLEDYNVAINEYTKQIILTSYGWLLYDNYNAKHHFNDYQETEVDIDEEEEFSDKKEMPHNVSEKAIQIAEFIPLIWELDTNYTNVLFSKLFNIIPKIEKRIKNANWEFINDYCDYVGLNHLSAVCESGMTKSKGKMIKMEFSSDKENWYAYKSKALWELGMFQECYDLSKQALEAFQKFHYSNDAWFARRMALSQKQLGNFNDAIIELRKIHTRKQEWFIEKELAELYKETGEIEIALKYAIQGINNFGDLVLKGDLIFLVGELFESTKEYELAFLHFSLLRLIRINEGWKIPPKLSSVIDHFGKETIPIEKLENLKFELTKYWRNF